MNLDYTEILEKVYFDSSIHLGKGKVAEYIPELSKVDPDQLGISVCHNSGNEYVIGCAEKSFSIQSISKVFSLTLAYKLLGEKLWNRLGREPSGNRFDSLILLEKENGIPRNPFINAGALVIADILLSSYQNPVNVLLDFVRDLSGNPQIDICSKVMNSEIKWANRNYALAYYMKSHNNIQSNVDELIEVYSAFCALEMSCVDLARSFRIFSANGTNPWTGYKHLSTSQNKRINSVMMTCGLYNSVGEFAYRVGIPAKSGVGGGIVGVIPNEMTIAVWSPALDATGNSYVGIKSLEKFTTLTGKSIF